MTRRVDPAVDSPYLPREKAEVEILANPVRVCIELYTIILGRAAFVNWALCRVVMAVRQVGDEGFDRQRCKS